MQVFDILFSLVIPKVGFYSTKFGPSFLELLGDSGIDKKVGGEVEHDKEMGHRLQAHDPQGRNVLLLLLDTLNLNIWKLCW